MARGPRRGREPKGPGQKKERRKPLRAVLPAEEAPTVDAFALKPSAAEPLPSAPEGVGPDVVDAAIDEAFAEAAETERAPDASAPEAATVLIPPEERPTERGPAVTSEAYTLPAERLAEEMATERLVAMPFVSGTTFDQGSYSFGFPDSSEVVVLKVEGYTLDNERYDDLTEAKTFRFHNAVEQTFEIVVGIDVDNKAYVSLTINDEVTTKTVTEASTQKALIDLVRQICAQAVLELAIAMPAAEEPQPDNSLIFEAPTEKAVTERAEPADNLAEAAERSLAGPAVATAARLDAALTQAGVPEAKKGWLRRNWKKIAAVIAGVAVGIAVLKLPEITDWARSTPDRDVPVQVAAPPEVAPDVSAPAEAAPAVVEAGPKKETLKVTVKRGQGFWHALKERMPNPSNQEIASTLAEAGLLNYGVVYNPDHPVSVDVGDDGELKLYDGNQETTLQALLDAKLVYSRAETVPAAPDIAATSVPDAPSIELAPDTTGGPAGEPVAPEAPPEAGPEAAPTQPTTLDGALSAYGEAQAALNALASDDDRTAAEQQLAAALKNLNDALAQEARTMAIVRLQPQYPLDRRYGTIPLPDEVSPEAATVPIFREKDLWKKALALFSDEALPPNSDEREARKAFRVELAAHPKGMQLKGLTFAQEGGLTVAWVAGLDGAFHYAVSPRDLEHVVAYWKNYQTTAAEEAPTELSAATIAAEAPTAPLAAPGEAPTENVIRTIESLSAPGVKPRYRDFQSHLLNNLSVETSVEVRGITWKNTGATIYLSAGGGTEYPLTPSMLRAVNRLMEETTGTITPGQFVAAVPESMR